MTDREGEHPADNGAPSAFRHRYPSCESRDLRASSGGRLSCRDCEKRHKLERKDRRHRERGDRCGCGADVVSLNPAEAVVHNWGGGPCRIVQTSLIPPAVPAEPDAGDVEALARDLTRKVLLHYGYTLDLIIEAEQVHPGRACSEEQCFDEETGNSKHGSIHDELGAMEAVMVDVVVPHVTDWLAAVRREAERNTREQVAQAIEALPVYYVQGGGGGWMHAVRTEAALRAARIGGNK